MFIFPYTGANVYPTLKTVTNPYKFGVAGTEVVAFSGQNTDDVLRNSDLDNPLDALESLMEWSHWAPTCPDTLGCFPYRDQDPFIVDKDVPHLLVSGNHDAFEER